MGLADVTRHWGHVAVNGMEQPGTGNKGAEVSISSEAAVPLQRAGTARR